MQDREKIRQLFKRYSRGECTPDEQAKLHTWFNMYARQEAHGLDDLLATYRAEQAAARRGKLGWLPYAAVFIAVLAGLWWFYDAAQNDLNVERTAAQTYDIPPGRNRAMLTLADGRTVDLNEEQKGIVLGDVIRYLDGSSVIEEQADIPGRSRELSTPKGGTYQVDLPDGTHVWLNAASKLSYPERFADLDRTVEIRGEAYFSVAKDKHRPFKIRSRGQEIVVTGTEFNVSAYEDADVKTTLVDGIVWLRAEISGRKIQLFPGEEGVIQNGNIVKYSVDPAAAVAWKEGNFYFDNTPLDEMMKQIERWYDVEVIYQGPVPQERFSGQMSRNITLQTVLQLLKLSEIKYTLSNKQLIIE